ncbi:protein BREAST CANCER SUSCEPTIBILITY 1 homolog [Punica granatum]|uniref:Protein BREAST CANCER SUSCEPTIBILITY 1 homolog n=1 Tax=Punica granatum TaxID=22663 RepID=A0A218VVA5_PUNGR|nr:protein BREAST CANCER SUSCEPTIBILITY 1 homolog [Punica granatum]OWM63832.1 hypothetical protein CDL15_Pgr006094 [Punica granatum]
MAADPIHLERMGRELKCPICLSLLNSSVSLACNHIFCNLCIMTTMKSGSGCPVCKVPFRRREVRPAPHMDNLVSIYKNMEVASGANMFVTQTAHRAKLSEGGKKPEGVSAEGTEINKRSSRGKRPRKTNNSNVENSSPLRVKPSCPTKKRVQVPRHPPKETPTRAANPDNDLGEINSDRRKNIPAESAKKPPLNENGEPVLMPFFWLREEDAEKSTQLSDGDQSTGTPLNLPTFSDIKDSDDEMPSPLNKEVDGVPPATEFFDSEMFEWTQRPCSPELCSSPLRLQGSDNNEKDLELARKNSISNEDVNKPKKRSRPARTKAQQNSLKSDTTQNKAAEGCQQARTYTARKMSSRRKTQLSSAVLTETTYENLSADISDGCARRYIADSFDASDSAENTNSKKICEVNTPVEKDSCTLLKKRKVASTLAKSERNNARRKKSEAGPNCNQESNSKKNTTCSSHVVSDAELVLRKCDTITRETRCAFCHSSECSEASGEMVHYRDGRPVSVDDSDGFRVIHSHKNCVEWAPNIYFEDEKAINLEAELARSRRIKCSCCGIKGAALGCFEKSCRKSFHVTCAKLIPQCRWDDVNFVMLCPLHVSSKLPIEAACEETRKSSIPKERPQKSHDQVLRRNDARSFKWNHNGPRDRMVLCCSTLTAAEREMVSKFERSSRVTVRKKWDSKVTHVIASTDENGACRRTLKVLMGILEGKWILSVDWIKACIEAMGHVDEQKYEITVDVHGMRDGPRLGRLRVLNMQPKLFEGLKFYFTGEFEPSYRGYLQDLVVAGGGNLLHRKPVSRDDEKPKSSIFIVYNLETSDKLDVNKDTVARQRKSDAEALAAQTVAKVVSNSWILNSIAACKLQDFHC